MKEAQADAAKVGAMVNPTGLKGNPDGMWDFNDHNVARVVEFDVAVEATGESESKGGIGVVIAAIGFGTQHKSGESQSALSRLKFSVPILLPPR